MKKWTKDEDEFLIACCEMKWVYKDIANELGRGHSSILHRAHRIKVSNNKTDTRKHEKYVEELKIKCPTLLCLGQYINDKRSILHKCLICSKEYKTRPSSKLKGYGCKFCGYKNNFGSGINPHKKGITYLVYIPKYDLYKFGITSRTIKIRMNDIKLKISDYEIILERKFSKGIDAMSLEKEWKENLIQYLLNTELLKTGNTETFRI